MTSFALRRLGAGLILLVVISAVTYVLLFFSGQSIARNILGDQATAEQVAAKEAELGLNQPLMTRFFASRHCWESPPRSDEAGWTDSSRSPR